MSRLLKHQSDASLEKEFIEIVQKTTVFSEDTHEGKYILKTPRIRLLHFMVDPNSLETKKAIWERA
jgi:hypothetical protein